MRQCCLHAPGRNRCDRLRILLRLSPVILSLIGPIHATNAEGRDPWQWPFASGSIWNVPIGSDARYVDAGLPAPGHIGCDIEWLIKTKPGDPVCRVFTPSAWRKRWPGDKELGELRVPDSLIIPDAAPPHTPNACAAFLMPDGRTVRQMEPVCRLEKAPRIVGFLYPEDQDLYGAGIKGAHYGSGLSVLGGSIRLGELISPDPLRHCLKLNVWGKYLYYSPERPGFRWPADRCDAYAAQGYQGKNPKLVMGSLLALPPEMKPDDLGVRSEVGRKIFHALQDYGAYVTDDAGWDASDLCVERGVPEEVEKAFGYAMQGSEGKFVEEMKRMVAALKIVNNSSISRIGGGGTPRRPLAPELDRP